MRILYLAHRIPFPPNKGDKLRAFKQIERLSRRHDVTLACFVDDPGDRAHVDALRGYCDDVVAVDLPRWVSRFRGALGLLASKTFTEQFYRHPDMLYEVERLTRQEAFDVAVAFSSGMAPYLMKTRVRRRVMDYCDCDSEKWLAYARNARLPMRLVYKTEGARLAHRERAWASAFDATILITDVEATSLRPYVGKGRLHVVGNGASLPVLPKLEPPHPPTVGFVGVMNYHPNVDAMRWFVDRCWVAVRDAVPGARLLIVGRSPVGSVRRLERSPGVHVTGAVADLAPVLAQIDVSVAPLRIARGLQNKVLEAMAAGKPVVMTPVARAGLGGQDGRAYLVATSEEAIIRDVRRLLRDGERRRRIGHAARLYVAQHHRWDDVLDRFELIVTGDVRGTAPLAAVTARTAGGAVYRGQGREHACTPFTFLTGDAAEGGRQAARASSGTGGASSGRSPGGSRETTGG